MRIIMALLMGILMCLFSTSCKQPIQNTQETSHPTEMTHWSSDFEFFSEFSVADSGNKIKALVHITHLSDFSPFKEGTLIMTFKELDTLKSSEISNFKLVQPGILKSEFKLPEGHYRAIYHVTTANETFDVEAGTLEVEPPDHNNDSDHHAHANRAQEEENDSSPGLAFLKEQQWKINFATAFAKEDQIFDSIKAYGQVLPKAGNEMIITSPLDGIIVSETWPVAGSIVDAQDIIFFIIPAISQDQSLTAINSKVKTIEAEYRILKPRTEQLKTLLEKGSVSRWEYEDAKTKLGMLLTELTSARLDHKTAQAFRNRENNEREQVHVRAPFDGAIVHVKVTPEQFVSAGTELVHIVKPTPVYLDLSLSLKQVNRLTTNIHGLFLRTSAQQEPHFFPKEDVRFLSTTPGANPETGKLSSLFELNLETMTLPFQSAIEAEVLLIPSGTGIVVPHTALVDDAGRDVIYLQKSGEEFMRKEVRIIKRQGTRVCVTGISAGDRIVTTGGNTLRRLELVGSGGYSGHGHEH